MPRAAISIPTGSPARSASPARRRRRCRRSTRSLSIFATMPAFAAIARKAAATALSAKWPSIRPRSPVINELFTPTPQALAQAQEIVDAFAANPGAGVVGLRGVMVDRPHLARAQRLLRVARRRRDLRARPTTPIHDFGIEHALLAELELGAAGCWPSGTAR